MTFGEKLRSIREAAGLTQAALAEKAGIGLSTVKDYERDRRAPSLEVGLILAKLTGVSTQEFEGCEFYHANQREGSVASPQPPAKIGRPPKQPEKEEPKPKQKRKKE